MQATDWIAIYAAFVGTGGLVLQGVSWWRAGARLAVSLMPEALFVGGEPVDVKTKSWVVVTVVNRGDRPTTLTHLGVREFRSRAHFLRGRPETRAFLIPNPEINGELNSLPFKLEPGAKWTGAIARRDEVLALIESGRAYAGISATHKDATTYMRIPPPKPQAAPRSE